MQPLKSFCNKPPSNPVTFEQEKPQKPGPETVSTLHWSKNDILPFLKFLEKKVFRLDNLAPVHFCTTLGVVICKNHVARPLHSFNRCRKFHLLSLETFFCRNLKNAGMSFLANVMLRQSHVRASRASPAQESKGFEGGLYQKLFKGYIFCFLSHLVGGQLFEQFAKETNLKKKRSVILPQHQVCFHPIWLLYLINCSRAYFFSFFSGIQILLEKRKKMQSRYNFT